MDYRRGGRPPQVRPRPDSFGRPFRPKVRPVAPSPQRLARHRRIDRRRGLPLPFGAVLAAAVAALGIGILWVAGGAVGPVVGSMVSGLGGFVNTVGAVVGSAPPTASPPTSDAPTIIAPDQPFTNDDTVDITVDVPSDVTGLPGYSIRLWVTVGDNAPVVAAEQPIGQTAVQLLPNIALAKGSNSFQASVVGPGGESDRSPAVAWTLDTSKPKLTIISPKDGSTTSKDTVTIKGKTQANSSIRVRNDENGATTTVDADKDGLFQARIAIAAGVNSIQVTTTDPAGNPNDVALSIRKGSGKPSASLTASTYQFRASKLPKPITLTVTVTDPDGNPVQGATALFTVSVPGLEAIVSSQINTNKNGVARFATTIPKGAMAGAGLATVLISTDEFGNLTDRQVLTVRH